MAARATAALILAAALALLPLAGCAHTRKNADPPPIPEGFHEVPEQLWSWCTMATVTADAELPDRPRRPFALWHDQTRALALPDECDALREPYAGPDDVRAHELLPGARRPEDVPDPWRVLVGEDKRLLVDPDKVAWIALDGDAVEPFWSVGAWSSDEERYLLLRGLRAGDATVVIQTRAGRRFDLRVEVFRPGG